MGSAGAARMMWAQQQHRGGRSAYRAAFYVALAFSFVMACLPQAAPPGGGVDKYQHVLAFGVLTTLALFSWPRYPGRVVGGLAFYGAFIEIVQAIPVLNRSSDIADWVADVIAIFAALLMVQLMRRFL